ncbi:hypothetical protein [Microbacterium sp. LjRoot45]|uniref:hypothetical protein n=1 Tax=Microbacterium sp. LjRoot45 TaxID=3342329 RepID=UPI003F50076F
MAPTSAHRHFRRSRLLPLILAGALAATITGCSVAADDQPTPRASDASPTASPTASSDAAPGSPCTLLDDETVADLVGASSAGVETTPPGTELPVCQYAATDGGGVQVAQMPAAEWARALPALVESILALPEGAVPDSLRSQIEDAVNAVESGSTIEPEAACGYFSQLLEAAGQGAGLVSSIAYLPDRESAVAVSGQQCIDGTYTSLLVYRDGIATDEQIVDQVSGILDQLG